MYLIWLQNVNAAAMDLQILPVLHMGPVLARKIMMATSASHAKLGFMTTLIATVSLLFMLQHVLLVFCFFRL